MDLCVYVYLLVGCCGIIAPKQMISIICFIKSRLDRKKVKALLKNLTKDFLFTTVMNINTLIAQSSLLQVNSIVPTEVFIEVFLLETTLFSIHDPIESFFLLTAPYKYHGAMQVKIVYGADPKLRRHTYISLRN